MDLVFNRDGYCGVKCSLPKDYNDPYELFLGVDLNVSTESLATYRDIIQELPHFPTTCFSKSPIVAPMWAHYAQNHSGFVLEFDVESLKDNFEEIEIRDVDYKAEPNPALADSLERAAVTKKPRHAVWLRQAVLTEAYFSKYQEWSYEQECRLVDRNQYVEDVGGNKILFVPSDCVAAMIVGSKFPEDKKAQSKDVAVAQGIDWYQLGIGKSLPLPYMTSSDDGAYVFEAGEITEALGVCESCSEPLPLGGELCVWCSITDDHAEEAARGNPFRILDHYGRLEEYFEGVRNIESRRKK
ncbi:hypothetical protein CUV01_15905 [Paracoccus tegillarcae]|uniref:DUF2971 domain-containing protein n=2 Tax=Paracoccus tegillarcae TaxID=1529068 RepID=A0A2K9EI52_9RHOB|nr:hypothetical protein CUV01_15905 [Paracoccus tegillarcae]